MVIQKRGFLFLEKSDCQREEKNYFSKTKKIKMTPNHFFSLTFNHFWFSFKDYQKRRS